MKKNKSTSTQGGPRPGAGRPPKDPAKGTRIKTAITLTPEHHAATAGDRSAMIEAGLDLLLRLFENTSKVNELSEGATE